MLTDEKRGVKGLRLHDNTTTSQMFADDTALFLQATLENLSMTLSILTIRTEALGGELNYNKSVAIYICTTSKQRTWTDDLGFKWLEQGQQTTYLGFLFGFKVAQ